MGGQHAALFGQTGFSRGDIPFGALLLGSRFFASLRQAVPEPRGVRKGLPWWLTALVTAT